MLWWWVAVLAAASPESVGAKAKPAPVPQIGIGRLNG